MGERLVALREKSSVEGRHHRAGGHKVTKRGAASGRDARFRFISKEESMIRKGFLFSVSLLFAATVLAQAAGEARAKAAPKDPANRLVVVPADDLKWADLDPKGAPGVKIADLWGNHATGAFGALVQLPAGFAVPLHTHT